MAKGASVALRHKVKTYKGQTYESFVGSLKVGNKTVLISINAENGRPVIIDSEYRGQAQSTVWANCYDVAPQGQRKRRNEL